MDRNIQESKEYRLAKEWEMAVNSYSFDPRKFAAAIPGMHPTNQQSCNRKSGIHQNRQRGYIKNCNNRTSETVTTVHQKR